MMPSPLDTISPRIRSERSPPRDGPGRALDFENPNAPFPNLGFTLGAARGVGRILPLFVHRAQIEIITGASGMPW
jgi:hypothetical protein